LAFTLADLFWLEQRHRPVGQCLAFHFYPDSDYIPQQFPVHSWLGIHSKLQPVQEAGFPYPTRPHPQASTSNSSPRGLEQRLRQLQEALVETIGPGPRKPAPVGRTLAGLARIALEHLSGGATPGAQLALVNPKLVGLLQSHAPRAISTGNLLCIPRPAALGDPITAPFLPGARPATFRQVLRDGSIRLKLVWMAASSAVAPCVRLGAVARGDGSGAGWAPGTFDVGDRFDEFHHAPPPAYERWLAHLAPFPAARPHATPETIRRCSNSPLVSGATTPLRNYGLGASTTGTDLLADRNGGRNGYASEVRLTNL